MGEFVFHKLGDSSRLIKLLQEDLNFGLKKRSTLCCDAFKFVNLITKQILN